jgi:hypothetical protein
MFQSGASYVDAGQQHYEERYRARAVQKLERKARALGFNCCLHKLAAEQHKINGFSRLPF